jgi:ribonuclease III
LSEFLKKLNNITKDFRYKFGDKNLLRLALTHGSSKEINNQRLEFLGDAILNLVIAEYLYQINPTANEGELTRIRSYLVKENTLALIARNLFVQNYIILGQGEQKTGGFNKDSILSDTLEAIIGAIYLDSDFLTVKNLILSWYLDSIELQELIKIDNNIKDPKTILQEILQAKGFALPVYNIIAITGNAHNQMFQIECIVESIGQKIYGVGASRKKAEQDAASKILKIL